MLNKFSLSLQLPDISHLTKSAAIHHIVYILIIIITKSWDFPGVPMVKSSPSSSGDAGSIPGWGTKILYVKGVTKNVFKM